MNRSRPSRTRPAISRTQASLGAPARASAPFA